MHIDAVNSCTEVCFVLGKAENLINFFKFFDWALNYLLTIIEKKFKKSKMSQGYIDSSKRVKIFWKLHHVYRK